MARPFRHRDLDRGDRRLGAEADARTMRRHVRACALGPGRRARSSSRATGSARSRFITAASAATSCSPPSSRRSARIRSSTRRSTGSALAPARGARLCPGAPVHLPRHLQASARRRSSTVTPRHGEARPSLIGPTARSSSRASPIRSPDEGAAMAALEAGARRRDRRAVGRRRAGRRLPVGRDRHSSTIVALWRKHSSHAGQHLSIGFEEAGFDEAPYARAVARHFGTDHHRTLRHRGRSARGDPAPPRIYDEPFADPSQIPTWLMSRLARRDVTVAFPATAATNCSAAIPAI